ncbi:co-chaperone YbbN, partial [Mesorhizobium sp. M5C.F.Ca.ET.164.01.1.1]
MSDNNPFGNSGGPYATTVQYGGGEPKRSLGEAPADLIKDTTTASFAADVVQ